MTPTLDEVIALGERATPRPWWELEDCGDYHILIGEQEDRVCECHNEECKPQENAAFIVAACNSAVPLAKKLKRVREIMGPELERSNPPGMRAFAAEYPGSRYVIHVTVAEARELAELLKDCGE